MDENLGCEIVDYIHLPSDMKTLQILLDNRRLELMTMGDFDFDGTLKLDPALLENDPNVIIELLAA